MSNENITPATLIETPDQLSSMVSDLSNQEMISVDTESNSLYEYQEKICLIQFSTADMDYLVDTIKLNDLSPLNKIFSSESIEKIFHAAEYDLMCLKRDFLFEFNNIFDTMIASRILGFNSIGLSSLLNKYFDVSMDKKYQRANWGKRPLSAEMRMYAQMDTHFLIRLREILIEKLRLQNKLELAQEDFLRMTNVEAFVNNKNNDNYWRIIKGNRLSAQQESVLIELYYLREKLANQLNRPPFKVFSNQVIIDIAKIIPKEIKQLDHMNTISPKLVQKFGEKIIYAVNQGLANNPQSKKEKFKPDPDFIKKYDALKTWRKIKGNEMSVDSDIILPKEHLEQLAHLRKCELTEIQSVMDNIPYRFEKFGKEILSILETS